MSGLSSGIAHALRYASRHRARFVDELKGLVRIPSVSADPAHARDVRACARWLADHLTSLDVGLVRVIPTAKHPIVVVESRDNANAPTVLIYGHYDVQPADKPHEWTTPPFEPVVRGGALYGRGSCDDKGQLFAHVKALEAWKRTTGALPVNIVCLFEGEEEIGSDSVRALLERAPYRVRADVALMSDMVMRGAGRPTITYSVRGELALELELCGADRDLHSGQFGGAVHDPAQSIAEVLATLHDRTGRVAVPGFYDDVRQLGPNERRYMRRAGPTDREILESAGAHVPWGEQGYSLYERTTARPSLSINGITTGYSGVGHKAVIPSRASAKVSIRLVPDQDPLVIARLLGQHLARVTPPTMRLTIQRSLAVPPAEVNLGADALRVAYEACAQSFGRPPTFVRLGGTIPIVSTLQQQLGIPSVMIGFALPDDRIHAADEHFELSNYFSGIATSIRFLGLLASRSDDKRRAGERIHDHRLPLSRREGRRIDRAVGY